MPGFREGGAGEYEKALRHKYEVTRARLQTRFDQSHDLSEREAVMKELET